MRTSSLTGAFPYALGLALALAALVAIRQRRTRSFALLVVCTFAVSPLAFTLLAVVLAGVAAALGRRALAAPIAIVAAVVAGALVLRLAFPDGGRYPFSAAEFAASLVFCALGLAFTWRVAGARILQVPWRGHQCR